MGRAVTEALGDAGGPLRMIQRQEAEAIALASISQPDPHWPDKPPMIIVQVENHELGWLIYYQSAKYVASGSISDALAGNGPLLISRTTGHFVHVGTAAPFEDRIAEAANSLRSESLRSRL